MTVHGTGSVHAIECLGAAADRIEELEAALRPLAAFAVEPSTAARQNDWPLWALNDTELTMGDVRRAARLLEQAQP